MKFLLDNIIGVLMEELFTILKVILKILPSAASATPTTTRRPIISMEDR